jgi:hypothetical protein
MEKLDLKELANQARQEIEIKDRKYHFKTYSQCFVGSDLVKWLLEI